MKYTYLILLIFLVGCSTNIKEQPQEQTKQLIQDKMEWLQRHGGDSASFWR